MKTQTTSRRASAPPHQPAKIWQLRLYVTDSTPKSLTAFSNLKKIFESQLKGCYRITVIDLLKQPSWPRATKSWPFPRWCASCRSPYEPS